MNMKHHKEIITRGLPKTGQVIEYLPYDDGYLQNGWWLGRRIADNKPRFIPKTIAGDDIVIDRTTGLMWPADGSKEGADNGSYVQWIAAVEYCNALTFAGFSDWYLPNVKELISILDYSQKLSALDSNFFIDFQNDGYWSSTTQSGLSTWAWWVGFDYGEIDAAAKTGVFPMVACRKF